MNGEQSAKFNMHHRMAAVALAALYLAVMSGHMHSIDGVLAYRQAQSLVFEQSVHFGTPLWEGAPFTTSKYGIGLSLLYIPGLLLWSWLQPYTPMHAAEPFSLMLGYGDPYYAWAGAPVHVLITALAAYLVGRVCLELGLGKTASLWGMALYGIGSPALIYARGDWGQQLEGLCWIAAVLGALQLRKQQASGAVICSVALAYAVLTRPVEGLLLAPVALLIMLPDIRWRSWSGTTWRGISFAVAGLLLGLLVTMLVNWARYGSPMASGYEGEGWTTPPAVGLAGALISPARGLLWGFPAVLLLPAGIRYLWGTEHRRVAMWLLALVLAQLLNVALWMWWWGGWNFGLRLFVPALPVVAVLVAAGIATLRGQARRVVPAFLLAGGLLFSLPGVLVDLMAGYGETFDGSTESFLWQGYPAFGALGYIHHPFAESLLDVNAVDILWMRLANTTGGLSLVPMAALLGLAGLALYRLLDRTDSRVRLRRAETSRT